MSFLKCKSHISVLGPIVLFAGLLGAASSAQAAGPFAGLESYWSGEGTISVANGTSERIRCRGSYAVEAGGAALNQSLRCASDSYRLEISSNVVASGSTVSGSWSESTRSASGNISGHISGGQISATVAGAGFTAGLSLSTRGKVQSVTIRPQGGTDIRDVSGHDAQELIATRRGRPKQRMAGPVPPTAIRFGLSHHVAGGCEDELFYPLPSDLTPQHP